MGGKRRLLKSTAVRSRFPWDMKREPVTPRRNLKRKLLQVPIFNPNTKGAYMYALQ